MRLTVLMWTKCGNVKCVWQGARNEWSKRGKNLWPCGTKYLLTSFPYVFLSTPTRDILTELSTAWCVVTFSFNCSIIVTVDDSSRNLLSSSPPASDSNECERGRRKRRIYSRKLETLTDQKGGREQRGWLKRYQVFLAFALSRMERSRNLIKGIM